MTRTLEERYGLSCLRSLGALEALDFDALQCYPTFTQRAETDAQCVSDEVLTKTGDVNKSQIAHNVPGLFLRPVLRLVYNRTSHSSICIFISQLTRFEQRNLGNHLYCPAFNRAYRKVGTFTMSTTTCSSCGEHLIIHVTAELVPNGTDSPDVLCWACGFTNTADTSIDGENEPPGPDDDPHGITARNAWKDEEYGLGDGCG